MAARSRPPCFLSMGLPMPSGTGATLADDVVRLLQQLMTIKSTSGAEAEAVDYLVNGLISDGWFVQRQEIDERGRANVYATQFPIGQHAPPRLVFNSHIDTVPPHVDFSKDEHNVYGRGSCDAKGQVAAMIVAARKLVRRRPSIAKDIALLFVVGEEVDHVGMLQANELQCFAPDYLVVGEPTEMKFCSGQKGACKIRLRVRGRAGHSGYAHAGQSAVHTLVQILGDIMAYEWPKDEIMGETTYNIGEIHGGQALNAWAAQAEAAIFFRVTTSYADIKARVESIVAGRAEIDHTLGGNDPVQLSLPSFPHEVGQAAFNTDIPYYKDYLSLKGVYLFGAGSITVAHGPGEYVPMAELRAAVEVYERLAEALLLPEIEYAAEVFAN